MMKNKKINLGKNCSSFLVPIDSRCYAGQVIYINHKLCFIDKTNFITMEVRIYTNDPEDCIEYEVKDL